ncbi:hypothetical protein SDC9_160594 [bioreactor metagenome]|uniref:Uncharacterized protein n=1 Tax=bioreactor metagenome TaxID=1076179 RepID=A0A645FM54_9ZZZZ
MTNQIHQYELASFMITLSDIIKSRDLTRRSKYYGPSFRTILYFVKSLIKIALNVF